MTFWCRMVCCGVVSYWCGGMVVVWCDGNGDEYGSLVGWSPVVSWNGVGGGVMLFDVVLCIVERYFVLWSGIVYCDGRVVLW